MTWVAILGSSLGCYLVKLTGLSVPERILQNRRVVRVAVLLPIALLASLIATQTLSNGQRLTIDARAAGLAAAVVAQRLGAPFLVVVSVAAATAGILRAVT